MAYLAGQLVLAVDAGAPNNGQGEATTGRVKTAWVRRKLHTYVSAQAYRRWLRDTMATQGSPTSPVERSGSGKSQKANTGANPIRYPDDDLFGYMKAGARSDDSGTTLRDSPFMLGTLMSVAPVRPTEDFGVMAREVSDPVLHGHEFYSAELAAPFLLDLPRIGTFTLPGKRWGRPNYLSSEDALQIAEGLQAGAQQIEFRGQDAVRLPLEDRRERAALLLDAWADVAGGAKKALHYGDRTAAFLMMTPMKGGVNPFAFVLAAPDERQLEVRADVLDKELAAWDGEWEAPVRIGWRPGFADRTREQFEKQLSDRIAKKEIVIDHPRSMLRALATDIRGGDLDSWFDDPVREPA